MHQESESLSNSKSELLAPLAKLSPHQSEANAIKQHFGGVETMRKQMGLSRKQACDLLLVDASAWSRWVKVNPKTGECQEQAPPHVYRTMQLLFQYYKEKSGLPGKINSSTSKGPLQINHDGQANAALEKWQEEMQLNQDAVWSQFDNIQNQVQKREELTLGWKLLLILNTAFLLYYIVT